MADNFRSQNPTLNMDRFQTAAQEASATEANPADVMTVGGAVNRALALSGLLLIGASFAWSMVAAKSPMIPVLFYGGLIVGLIASLACMFAPKLSPYAAPVFAIAEGLALGTISAAVSAVPKYAGIVTQAAALTILTLVVMLALYRLNIIRATEKFKAIMFTASICVGLFFIITFVMSLCGVNMSFMRDSSALSIGISAALVLFFSFMLIMDFDQIEECARVGAPRYMEWYTAFALMLTLVNLYLTLLQLLMKMSGSNRDE